MYRRTHMGTTEKYATPILATILIVVFVCLCLIVVVV